MLELCGVEERMVEAAAGGRRGSDKYLEEVFVK
jgi:hypothetical protein